MNQPEVLTREEPARDEIYGEFARIEEAERAAAAAVTLQALVNRARAKSEPAALPAAPPLALAEPAPPASAPETATVELTVEPAIPVTGAVHAPVPRVRKIFTPEDNHDFPL